MPYGCQQLCAGVPLCAPACDNRCVLWTSEWVPPAVPALYAVAVASNMTRMLCCAVPCRPAGSGSFEHIGDETPLPQAIPLKEGVFEVGRTSPADIQIPIPTVSSRHALLRVGESAAASGRSVASCLDSRKAQEKSPRKALVASLGGGVEACSWMDGIQLRVHVST